MTQRSFSRGIETAIIRFLTKLSKIVHLLGRQHRWRGIISLFLLSFSLSFIFLISTGEKALSAPPTLNILIRDPASPGSFGQTGTTPFDANNNPGNDSSATNDVVRTADLITYDFNYNILNAAADNLTITSTLPNDGSGTFFMDWQSLPLPCTGAGSSISADKQTLTCNLGNKPLGSTGSVLATARVRGSTSDGTLLSPSVQITSSTSGANTVSRTGYFDNAGNLTRSADRVSAAAIFDLQKRVMDAPFSLGGFGGVPGYFIRYHLGVALPTGKGKGTAPLSSPITITDTINAASFDTGQATPNLSLQLASYDSRFPVCGINGQPALTGAGNYTFSGYPYGRIGVRSNATENNSVQDSGTITCSQPGGPGTPISITITGANTTADSVPTVNANGQTLTEKYVVSAYLQVFIPLSEVAKPEDVNGATGTGVARTYNIFSPLNTLDISGQPNTETSSTNNRAVVQVTYSPGSVSKYFFKTPTTTLDEYVSGVNYGEVAPNQTFVMRLDMANTSPGELTDWKLCDRIDSSKYVLTPATGTAASVPSFLPANQVYFVNGDPNAIVEFSSSPLPPASQRSGWNAAPIGTETQINCNDSDGPWQPLSSFTPDANNTYPMITKVRVKLGSIPVGGRVYASFAVKALPNPVGTVLPNWHSYRTAAAEGTYAYGGYWQATITGVQVRITKETIPVGQSQVLSGDLITYKLQPRTSSILSNPPALVEPVIITDTLPKDVSYEPGTATLTPDSVTVNGDGTSTVIWKFNNVIPGQPLPAITFKARVSFGMANNTNFTNRVVISHPDDPAPLNQRTATWGMRAIAPGAMSVGKSTMTTLLQKNGTMTFNLGYANLGGTAFSKTDYIDIFPYNGSALGSNFSGSLTLQSISGTHGETFEYTTTSPDQINLDPGCVSNGGTITTGCQAVTPSITAWQTLPAGLPPSNITAIRIKGGNFPVAASPRTVTLVLETSGNQKGDRYINQYGGRADISALPVISNPVTVEVINPQISIVKRITAINNTRISTVVDPNLTAELDDNSEKWSDGYLKGAIDGGMVMPGDDLEYTIYFIANGNVPLTNVNICDLVPENSTFVPNSYNSQSPKDNGLPGVDSGIAVAVGSTNPTVYMTNVKDAPDRGEFYAPNAILPASLPCSGTNTNGAVVVNLVQSPAIFPNATGKGIPNNSYGFMRFHAKVK
jgi:uncharacterized repeat protein (TIGR01451 family)